MQELLTAPVNNHLKEEVSKLWAIENHVSQVIKGRGELLHTILQALVTGDPILVLGEPGTAKTTVAELVFDCFYETNSRKAKVYKTPPLKGTTTLERIIGPNDIRELLENYIYKTVTKNGALSARFVIWDEVTRAGDDVLDGVLEWLRTNKVSTGFEELVGQAFLHLGTSNFVPQGAAYQAFLDRWIFRVWTAPLTGQDSFDLNEYYRLRAMGRLTYGSEQPEVSLDTLIYLRQMCRTINIPASIVNTLLELYHELEQKADIRISDRRQGYIYRILQAEALLSGDSEVAEEHILNALRYVIWLDPTQADIVKTLLMTKSGEFANKVATFENDIKTLYQNFKVEIGKDPKNSTVCISTANSLTALFDEITKFVATYQGGMTPTKDRQINNLLDDIERKRIEVNQGLIAASQIPTTRVLKRGI